MSCHLSAYKSVFFSIRKTPSLLERRVASKKESVLLIEISEISHYHIYHTLRHNLYHNLEKNKDDIIPVIMQIISYVIFL